MVRGTFMGHFYCGPKDGAGGMASDAAAQPSARPRVRASASRPAAVDDEGGAHQVAPRVTGQQQERAVELLGSAGPPKWRRPLDPLSAALVVEHGCGQLALEVAGRDGVDPDPL